MRSPIRGWRCSAHLQPPAPDYPRVIHDGVMKSSGAPAGGFPSSLKHSLDPSGVCVWTRQGCGIHPSCTTAAGPAWRTRSQKGAQTVSRRGLKNTKVKQSHSVCFIKDVLKQLPQLLFLSPVSQGCRSCCLSAGCAPSRSILDILPMLVRSDAVQEARTMSMQDQISSEEPPQET